MPQATQSGRNINPSFETSFGTSATPEQFLALTVSFGSNPLTAKKCVN